MRRPLKFRYKDADGKPFYKELTLPDDAVQLVAHDKNGREVYEGDVVILEFPEDNFRKEYTVNLRGEAVAEDGCWLWAAKIAKDTTLKENANATA